MLPTSYRDCFKCEGAGARYDSEQYQQGTFWDVQWALEQSLLEREVRPVAGGRYLDFACGTGRILAFLEDRFAEAIGVDVSDAMLTRARARVRRAELRRQDITMVPLAGEQFDCITAFRFLLNAEPSLRHSALRALAGLLRSTESRLIVNNHGNLVSFKIATAAVGWCRSQFANHPTENYLTNRAMLAMLRGAGLEVVSCHGTGIMPGRLVQRMGHARALRVEAAAMRLSALRRFAVNHVYVCRLASGG